MLSSNIVSADDNSTVDQISITVPMSCTMSGTGQDSHNANINNGTYTPDIGTTTMHVFCNDNEGFAIYAAGYTGDEIGGTNSNKLVGTSASGNAAIESGLATSAGNPDVSNWAMKLAITQDSGDTTETNAFAIDSAPNVALPSTAESGATQAPFSNYHVVPNEYVKVAHKNSDTDMAETTGGVKLTTTYAAYISKTQAADTYSGQVIYTLVHPSTAPAPVGAGKVGVTYHANGSTFAGGGTTNNVVYANNPMYIATTPLIAKSPNVADDGTKNTAYASDVNVLTPIAATGATKMKVVITYGVTNGTGLAIAKGNWDGMSSMPDIIIAQSENLAGTETYVFDGDTVTFYLNNFSGSAPVADYDYGFWARVYPIYTTEQFDTEASDEFTTFVASTGTYATTTDWYGSWYGDINGGHYDFMNEAEVTNFLSENISTLSGSTIDLYRGLTFIEAYTRANKSQDGGYYKQQELTKSMCNTIAITQNQTLKDVRDNNTYMVGKLKDGNCWMLDNLALDPTDSTTAQNMNESNTNATEEAIYNLLHGGSTNTGWSNTAVANVTTNFDNNDGYIQPRINNASKNTLVTSYGSASTNGQAKVGLYYNYCAASASTYCYASRQGIDVPDTIIDAPQDICPANWRMPTGGKTGEYSTLAQKYTNTATETNSLQYNLSTPLSGDYHGNAASVQGSYGIWWSSTYDSSDHMYRLGVEPTYVDPNNSSNRFYGQSMRCLLSE
ncbi:hypothetical protein IKG49_00685 [Candidatus Saccharibacteria bacterium]|nr:hypothetical protein [Candidatus Saccharibacteria bacterium]